MPIKLGRRDNSAPGTVVSCTLETLRRWYSSRYPSSVVAPQGGVTRKPTRRVCGLWAGCWIADFRPTFSPDANVRRRAADQW